MRGAEQLNTEQLAERLGMDAESLTELIAKIALDKTNLETATRLIRMTAAAGRKLEVHESFGYGDFACDNKNGAMIDTATGKHRTDGDGRPMTVTVEQAKIAAAEAARAATGVV